MNVCNPQGPWVTNADGLGRRIKDVGIAEYPRHFDSRIQQLRGTFDAGLQNILQHGPWLLYSATWSCPVPVVRPSTIELVSITPDCGSDWFSGRTMWVVEDGQEISFPLWHQNYKPFTFSARQIPHLIVAMGPAQLLFPKRTSPSCLNIVN